MVSSPPRTWRTVYVNPCSAYASANRVQVTAEGLDPHTTPVHAIMTRSPMVTRDTTSATEALELMVTRHFRHLPVCNEDGNVVGLLDIAKVFQEALGKVERSSSASEQLMSAMAGVQSEMGNIGGRLAPVHAKVCRASYALRARSTAPHAQQAAYEVRSVTPFPIAMLFRLIGTRPCARARANQDQRLGAGEGDDVCGRV